MSRNATQTAAVKTKSVYFVQISLMSWKIRNSNYPWLHLFTWWPLDVWDTSVAKTTDAQNLEGIFKAELIWSLVRYNLGSSLLLSWLWEPPLNTTYSLGLLWIGYLSEICKEMTCFSTKFADILNMQHFVLLGTTKQDTLTDLKSTKCNRYGCFCV